VVVSFIDNIYLLIGVVSSNTFLRFPESSLSIISTLARSCLSFKVHLILELKIEEDGKVNNIISLNKKKV